MPLDSMAVQCGPVERRWQYRAIILQFGTTQGLAEQLDALDKQRWEVVSITAAPRFDAALLVVLRADATDRPPEPAS